MIVDVPHHPLPNDWRRSVGRSGVFTVPRFSLPGRTMKNRTNRNMLLRVRARQTLIIVAISFACASGAALADATISMPPERETGLVVIAREASLLSLIDDLAARTGMVVKGLRHIVDREISGSYEGDMPVVLEALLKNESYMLVLGSAGGLGYTPVEKIIFTGQSEWTPPVKQADQDVTQKPDNPKTASVQPQKPEAETPEPMRTSPQVQTTITSPPPPEPPQVEAWILRAISRPPSDTIEGRRFDAAFEELSKELEQTLAPLKNLR